MARGKQVYLSYTALVLLSLAPYTTAGLWTVDIDLGPAPSPEDGPPFSAHASRDRSLLPYQIAGIVGSYVGSILIILTLLFTVGRSRRKQALDRAADARATEMVKPMNTAFDPSPISPVSSRSWYSPRKLKPKKSSASSIRSGNISNPVSPAGASVISFDAAVVEADRLKRQDEMERLYAAVMAQDDRKSQQKAMSPPLPPPPEIPSGSPPEYSRRKPPRLITNAPNLKHLQPGQAQYPTSPGSPSTPKSPIRAIYPPDGPIPPMPSGPTSPLRAEYPSNTMAPVYQPYQDQLYINRGRSASDSSARSAKKFRKSLKNIKISSPMIDDNSDGARTPLSPRYYANPGIPPDPPTGRTAETTDSQAYPPTTPGTGRSWRYGDDIPREVSQEEHFDRIHPLPQPNPQRQVPRIYPPPPAAPSPPRQTGLSAPLPFRQMGNHDKAPAKTTFLETRPRNQFLSAAMGTPRTGLATPYSPYMPFTPLTPVTPRLASKAERKQRLREERAIRGAVVEEDAVKEEGEIWGDGYS
ncbi:hypothetical protein E2P81_ATG10205 [Venturia nashicola]|nr:hypothetical protein E2P81_ATG10205 [Venturia nashicola]